MPKPPDCQLKCSILLKSSFYPILFRKNNLPLCDYSYFANLVECYFMSPYVIPMDEYGLPIQISNKIGRIMDISSDIDIALEQLRNFTPSQRNFSNIEREFIEEFKAYI